MENLKHFFETNDILKKSNLTNEDIFDTEVGVDSLIDKKIEEFLERTYGVNVTYKLNSYLKLTADKSAETTIYKSAIAAMLEICWMGNINEIYLEATSPCGWDFILNKSFDFRGIKIISDQVVKLDFSTPSTSLKNLTLEVNGDPKKIGIRIVKAAKLTNCTFKSAQISCQAPTFPVLNNCSIQSVYTCLNTTSTRKKWPENLLTGMSYVVSPYTANLLKDFFKPETIQQIIDQLNYDYKQWETLRLRIMYKAKYGRNARINFEHPKNSNNVFFYNPEKNQ